MLLVLAECAVGRNFVGAGPAVWQSPRGFLLATDTGTLMLQTSGRNIVMELREVSTNPQGGTSRSSSKLAAAIQGVARRERFVQPAVLGSGK